MSQAQLLPTDHFSPPVTLYHGRPATTSLDIARHFGKRHDDVLKSIRKLSTELPYDIRARNFAETSRTVAGPNNSERQEKIFTVYFDGFILLVMGYTGKKALQIKLLYIAAFNAMRDELAAQREAALPEVPHFVITPSTPASRKPLEKLVKVWAAQSGIIVAQCWTMLNAAFNLQSITELPEEWIPDAIAWVQGKIDEQGKTKALPAPEPATPNFRADFPADMEDGRKAALKKIQSLTWGIHAALDVVRLGCYPGPRTIKMRPEQREMYDTQFALYSVAVESLCAAYNALDAGYKLGRLYGRG